MCECLLALTICPAEARCWDAVGTEPEHMALSGWSLTCRDRCVGEPGHRRSDTGKQEGVRLVWTVTLGLRI